MFFFSIKVQKHIKKWFIPSKYLCNGSTCAASGDCNQRVPHLQRPGVHDFLDGYGRVKSPVSVGLRRQELPEVVLGCCRVGPENF